MKDKSGTTPIASTDQDTLIPDPQVFTEFGITRLTGWRWDHDETLIALGWPPPIKIRERKFRSRKQVETFKTNVLRRALQERGGRHD
jgi:hypothetical protein